MNKFRLHVLGLPHTRTTKEYNACAFTQKALKFCKMMTDRGHTVYHYGTEGSNPVCTEHVSVVSSEDFDRVYGHIPKNGPYDLDNQELYHEFHVNAIKEIGKRRQPLDIILPFWGIGMKPVCDAHYDLITIEPGIGYPGNFAKYRVYESYAWMHCQVADANSPMWYHTIIPNYFDLEDFDYNGSQDERLKYPYFLYIGRVQETKGVHIAMQVCEKLHVRLVIGGPIWDDNLRNLPDWVEYVGPVDMAMRRKLMKNATASFVASTYSEPFGGVAIENFLSGTPVISTDWGAFPETNIQGVTGYRCRTFDDFLTAALDCLDGKIKPEDCRRQGEKYSLENIAPMYEKFFGDVTNIYTGNGWYQL